ncbi:hypothetical protein [Aurantimonas sp. VKM B-3413]|nr:hypothetical protein [Aurantimonas sp. VKM B-3413]
MDTETIRGFVRLATEGQPLIGIQSFIGADLGAIRHAAGLD